MNKESDLEINFGLMHILKKYNLVGDNIVDEVENKHLDSYLSNISWSDTNLGNVQEDPRHINGLQPGVPTSNLIASALL
ncbi:hypothetical protein BB559_002999 [Furculomyces boomerangus]|uniref:Uncharacterized protein n=1 Tax=Furculomyces boomerangus TaxID=61424 RepID=A0A2T9YQ54_9FUNG|nr:hypothetical protein BB559_002999 [Furculomyces boomerangus]